MAGSLRWFVSLTGQELGRHAMDMTLGEVWLNHRNGKAVATRSFGGGGGNFTVLDAKTGAVVATIPDKFKGIAVNANLTMMLTPKESDTTTAQLFDATSGALLWEYTAAGGEGVIWALEVAGGDRARCGTVARRR